MFNSTLVCNIFALGGQFYATVMFNQLVVVKVLLSRTWFSCFLLRTCLCSFYVIGSCWMEQRSCLQKRRWLPVPRTCLFQILLPTWNSVIKSYFHCKGWNKLHFFNHSCWTTFSGVHAAINVGHLDYFLSSLTTHQWMIYTIHIKWKSC